MQIRGAVAEYERTVIADRTRRGRLAALQAGRLVPWSRPPYSYHADLRAPRDPAGLARDEAQAAVVRQIFAWYVEDGLPLQAIARRLTAAGTPTARGHPAQQRRPGDRVRQSAGARARPAALPAQRAPDGASGRPVDADTP